MLRALLFASVLVGIAGCRIALDKEKVDAAPSDAPPVAPMCEVNTTSMACMDATTHSDFTWLNDNVFSVQCQGQGCHDGTAGKPGSMNFKDPTQSYVSLMGGDGSGVTSMVATSATRFLVVPSHPESSYILLLLGVVPYTQVVPPDDAPDDIATSPDHDAQALYEGGLIGYMPSDQGAKLLCCQKLDAINRWVMAGAQND